MQLQANAVESVSFDELKELELQATRLSQPERTPVNLDATTSQGMAVGIWQFSPEIRSAGPWLIYSSKSSKSMVRPLLWNVPGQTTPERPKTLHAAVCIDGSELGSDAFQKIFKEMAKDNQHSGWDYLRSLWKRFPHLPLSTFPVWKDATRNNALLAAMVIQLDPEILDRLEEELPIMWELVPVPVWQEVLSAYQANLSAVLEDESIVESIIGDAIDRIAGLNDVMATVAKIVKQRQLNETVEDLRVMQGPRAGAMTAAFLAPAHQELLQRQADSQWPVLLKSEIEQAWRQLPIPLTELISGDQFYRATVVHLPIVLVQSLFVEAAETSGPLHVFKYRRLKQFDEDWYNAAFNYACGYWSQQDKDV